MNDEITAELRKAEISSEKFQSVVALLNKVAFYLFIVGLIYIILTGLRPFIGEETEPLVKLVEVLIKFIEALNLGTTIGFVVAGLLFILYTKERLGKKRIRKRYKSLKAENKAFRRKLELEDEEIEDEGDEE